MTMTPDEREFYNTTGPRMQERDAASPSGNAPPLHHDARHAAMGAEAVSFSTPANERPQDMPLINGWVLAYRDATLSGKVVWLPYLRRDGLVWTSIGAEEAGLLRAVAERIAKLEHAVEAIEINAQSARKHRERLEADKRKAYARIQELEASNSRQAGIFSTERTAHAASIRRTLELEAKLDFTKQLLKGSHAANLALTESWDQAETRSRELEAALRAVEYPLSNDAATWLCADCLGIREKGHLPECIVGRALAGGAG